MTKARRLTHPDGRTKTPHQWAAELRISPRTLYSRIADGWDAARILTTPPRTYAGIRSARAHEWQVDPHQTLIRELAKCASERGTLSHRLRRPPLRDMWDVPLERDPWAQAAIDVAAEDGGMTLDEIGVLMGGICRERVNQIVRVACKKLLAAKELEA